LGEVIFGYIAKFSTLAERPGSIFLALMLASFGAMKCQFKHSDSCERMLTPEEGGLLLTMNQVRIVFSSETTV
jgi:hypothetical protein